MVAACLSNLASLLKEIIRLSEAEPLYRRGLQILIDFQRRTGHEHPNSRGCVANFRAFLEALGKTPDQIEEEVDELSRRLGPDARDM